MRINLINEKDLNVYLTDFVYDNWFTVKGNFYCSDGQLKTLESAPQSRVIWYNGNLHKNCLIKSGGVKNQRMILKRKGIFLS